MILTFFFTKSFADILKVRLDQRFEKDYKFTDIRITNITVIATDERNAELSSQNPVLVLNKTLHEIIYSSGNIQQIEKIELLPNTKKLFLVINIVLEGQEYELNIYNGFAEKEGLGWAINEGEVSKNLVIKLDSNNFPPIPNRLTHEEDDAVSIPESSISSEPPEIIKKEDSNRNLKNLGIAEKLSHWRKNTVESQNDGEKEKNIKSKCNIM